MTTLIRPLEKALAHFDGSYLNDGELFVVEKYAKHFGTRLLTYTLLRDRAKDLVLQTLRDFASEYPELVKKHQARCVYDLSEMLRAIANAILHDSPQEFCDRTLDWFTTVIKGYSKTTQCASAYGKLQKAIDKLLPPDCANLVKPYTDLCVEHLTRGA
ncbi:MAG: phycocyanin [Oscillatoriales cyanobacterium SM2_1_8]|nr:phycocyanin [Oscillatoriales cyanobacterium SM2_1_8]